MSKDNTEELIRGDADLLNDNITKYAKDIRNANNKSKPNKQISEK